MTVTPFKAKAEERAKLTKKDEEKEDVERPAKRMCSQYEKQMAKMSGGDLQTDLLEYVASYRGEQASPGQHPAALVTEIFASDSDDHNTLHCQQLEGWYHDYAKLRNMTYLFKKPDSVVVDPSMDGETIKVPITCLKFCPPEDGFPAPSTLQLALRFSRVLEIYEHDGRHHADMTTEQRLQDVVTEFNQSSGLQAKHRIEGDRLGAVYNLLTGTTDESREIIRAHLDAHKWAYCAFSTEQFKGARWMLTASPKASSCPPELRKCLTVTAHSQCLHLRLVIKMFLDQGRRLRPSARARARLSSGHFDQICDFACVFSHVWQEARLLASWNEEKDQAMEKAFFMRILGFPLFKMLCETFMEKQCRISLVTKKDGFDTGLDSFIRSAAASHKVTPTDVDCILYFDCTKLGVLSQAEINLIGDYAEKTLFRNIQRLMLRSVLVLLPPLLCGSESGGSLRGDYRFCTSQLWLRQSLNSESFPKALDERSFVVPGEAFLSHDTRRSLTDLQETAQWLGGAAVCQSILESLTGGRKNFHAAVVLHPTLYDGCVEIASVRAGFSVLSSSGQPTNHNCGKEIVKTHLLEAWKAGRPPMDKATPRYKPTVWRLRFWANEKCIAPAKPLYHLPCDLELAKGSCKRLV
ncbi:unnamed protein product [Durusdinium trenchii]|uniref:Uncharacterized protein n=1 Tax=Durusdinium trenchii TaxID=1381693 RepID=A0ABP0IUA2_9DINO